MGKRQNDDRIGALNKNTFGSMMRVIEYKSYSDILVEFDQGKPIKTDWRSFCKGEVKNPYDKATCGVGFRGEGKYKTKENGKSTKQYITWNHILQKSYNKKCQERHSSYIGCSVSEEWYNFQNFAKWFDENYYEVEGLKMNLDKDILAKGNKMYSPETCVFVPQNINKLFIKSNKTRGNLPVGVSFDKTDNRYAASCNNHEGKTKKIGRFNTPEEAFCAYKVYKENLIRDVANTYKDKIPPRLHKAMLDYKVEIED